MPPSISVVTPTLNRAELIVRSVESVSAQSCPAIEHLVIDGCSSDDTLARLDAYPGLTVISEPDEGLYDAINKGISRARGDVIALVNTDDVLLPGALQAVANAFQRCPEADCVCGRIRLAPLSGIQGEVEIGTPAMQRLRGEDVISGLTLTNARFFRREVFEKVGLFDQAYPTLADRDFLGRFWLARLATVTVDVPLYRYGLHDGSLTFNGMAPSFGYVAEAVRLANDRFRKADTRHERRFYRRWLAWAVGYSAIRNANQGDSDRAERPRPEGLLPGWQFDFIRQLTWHLATRSERRGRPVSAAEVPVLR